jgi:decaprenylphospho-beta-D-erythro-pentofuranosid-2-ulose 2-reductase
VKDALGSVQSVLVLGGTSEIGLALAAELAGPRSATVVLAGRHQESLAAAASTLAGRAGRVETTPFDATDYASHDAVMDRAADLAGGDLDVVVIAFGLLDAPDPVDVAEVNYVGAVSAGLAARRRLQAQGHGAIVALSSVAGERVRRANFLYGSSKAGMDGFFSGMADDLAGTGVRVLIVRPGFVRTKMTLGMPEAPFATSPQAVAAVAAGGLRAGSTVVWAPPVLRPVFSVFRHLPRAVWRRMPG